MIGVNAFCPLPFQKIKITSEGNVSMCCFQDRECLGNILKTPFEEIWNSELAKEVRRTTAQGELHRTCQVTSCPFYHLKERPSQNVQYHDYPVDLELDLPSQHCNIGGEKPTESNQACLMCERHLFWYTQEDKVQEICERIRPYVCHLRSCHIQGIAEAFWKDRIFDVFNWLGIGPGEEQIVVSTTTNSTILTEPRRRRFLKYPRSVLTFSIDAATPETYKLIRRVDLFHRVTENLLAYSRERNPYWQHMRIHNNINLLNIHEVEGMVELAARANCDIEFNPTYAAPSICVNEWNAYLFEEAQEKIIETAKRLGVNATFMRNLTLDFEVKKLPSSSVRVRTDELVRSAATLGIPVQELLKRSPSELDFHLPVL